MIVHSIDLCRLVIIFTCTCIYEVYFLCFATGCAVSGLKFQ